MIFLCREFLFWCISNHISIDTDCHSLHLADQTFFGGGCACISSGIGSLSLSFLSANFSIVSIKNKAADNMGWGELLYNFIILHQGQPPEKTTYILSMKMLLLNTNGNPFMNSMYLQWHFLCVTTGGSLSILIRDNPLQARKVSQRVIDSRTSRTLDIPEEQSLDNNW